MYFVKKKGKYIVNILIIFNLLKTNKATFLLLLYATMSCNKWVCLSPLNIWKVSYQIWGSYRLWGCYRETRITFFTFNGFWWNLEQTFGNQTWHYFSSFSKMMFIMMLKNLLYIYTQSFTRSSNSNIFVVLNKNILL